ncbi:MAG: 2,4-dihydroxyhept-2-ene-1,7-dioic acid aldolase [Alphaproteobacteria bacterium]|nr:2,4-dihydroxyhept-2-ene-1,7-dioic acid aldolase [Alphaproteobacteria bacterium]
MSNMLKKRLLAGKACVNAWLAIPSGFSAEIMAQCGWDSVTVDMQHGVQDYQSMVQCFQAMDKHPVTPLVRVPWNEPGIVGKVLDGGAWGVICPMINTAAEAKALVSYCLYPPKGKRSNGPIRAGAYGSATPYQSIANDEVLVIPMIETQEAIDNIDAILDVPGISGIYIGPSDLGLSLGLVPKLDRDEPQVLAIYDKLVAAVKERKLFAGIHNTTASYAAKMIAKGFQFVTIANDSSLMSTAARAAVAQTRKEAGAIADK